MESFGVSWNEVAGLNEVHLVPPAKEAAEDGQHDTEKRAETGNPRDPDWTSRPRSRNV